MAMRAALRDAPRLAGMTMALLFVVACGGGTRDQPTAVAPAAGAEGSPITQDGAGTPLEPVPAHAQVLQIGRAHV